MTKIVPNINKYKYLIGSLIIILVSVIIFVSQLKKNNIYIYYDTNVTYCKNLNEYKKKEYLICYNDNEYSFKVKDKQSTEVIESLEKIKLTSIEQFFNNSKRNKSLFLVVKKENRYEILPVKMYQNLS